MRSLEILNWNKIRLTSLNRYPPIWLFALLFLSCRQEPRPLFELLPPERTGIDFVNPLQEDEHYNLYDYEYLYNGGGVGIIDVNNDGLPDIFLGGNTVSGRLYLNLGGLRFKDITESAGLTTEVWITGISVVDINRDGRQDLYLSVAGNKQVNDTRNLLFINNGLSEPGRPESVTFTEAAAQFGIDDPALTTQAAFFDYDVDGDLDLYLLNFANVKWAKERLYPKITDGSGIGSDKLYRNNGDGTFTEVGGEAGILVEGYGLGMAIFDINQDHYPDIYVANDYLDDDVLYINNQKGGFEDQLASYMKHTSYFSMGCDAADFNNDGRTDLMVLDMLPETHTRRKTLIGSFGLEKVNLRLQAGYHPSLVRNVLQLNNENGSFSEVGRLSGVESTDWSWAPLWADFDNDGLKDLYVTNGYKKEVSNLDILLTVNFGNYPPGSQQKTQVQQQQRTRFLEVMNALPETPIANFCFVNQGDLTFTDVTKQWGMHQPSFSNGAAYADLDQDGDLDLVVNNIDDPAFVYRNTSEQNEKPNHFLRIKLEADQWPSQSAKVFIHYGKQEVQYAEYSLTRGFQSSVEDVLHFGLGQHNIVDSLCVIWPGGKSTTRTNIAAGQLLTIPYDTEPSSARVATSLKPSLVQPCPSPALMAFRHKEDNFNDFKHNPLLPHLLSREGPSLVCGDLNGDGREDLVVGGAKEQPTTIFLADDTDYTPIEIPKRLAFEDMGMALLDYDGDHDLDLYVASGGNGSFAGSMDYADRLYENDGLGNFTLTTDIIPTINTNTSTVNVADFDRDGDPDIFVGGWVHPNQYPIHQTSYLLLNEGGTFRNISVDIPGLSNAGLVKSAIWSDIDLDGWQDLIVVGEWTPIRVFKNEEGRLREKTQDYGLEQYVGWWNSIQSGDFDNDGDTDYILGNLGRNTRYEADAQHPATLLAADIDQNGLIDPVIFCFEAEQQFPVHDRDELTARVSSLKKEFFTYRDYALADIDDLVKPNMQQRAYQRRATIFESILLRNDNGEFHPLPLPSSAQMAPVYGTLPLDLNEDAYLDLLLVGNSFSSAVSEGPYDSLNGLVLLGKGDGQFEVLSDQFFKVPGDAKALTATVTREGLRLIATQNNDGLCVFDLNNPSYLQAKPDDEYATLYFEDGTKRRVELNNAGGYLSASSAFLTLPENIARISIKNRYEMDEIEQ